MEKNSGFTLIELVITITIGAILVALAVPNFTTLIRNNRLATQTNEFITALNVARSEAVKRGVRVTVCASAGGAACTGGPWDQGWVVFTDPNNNATVNAAVNILRVHAALDGGNTLVGNQNVVNYVSYIPSGVTQQTGGALQLGTITLCSPDLNSARTITINSVGRPSRDEAAC